MVRHTLKILEQLLRDFVCLTILGHYALKGEELTQAEILFIKKRKKKERKNLK